MYDTDKINTHNFTTAEADSPIPYPADRRRELGMGFSLQFSCIENRSRLIRATLFSPQKSHPVKLIL